MSRRTGRVKSHRRLGRKLRRGWQGFVRSIRILFMLTVVACILFCVGAIAAKAARPYIISHGESREISEVNRQISKALAENTALKQEIALLSTHEGKEEEARKHGWVKEGEIALVIEQPPKSQTQGGKPADSAGSESFWHAAGWRILELFVRRDSRD